MPDATLNVKHVALYCGKFQQAVKLQNGHASSYEPYTVFILAWEINIAQSMKNSIDK